MQTKRRDWSSTCQQQEKIGLGAGGFVTVNGSVEGGETLFSRDVVEAAVEGNEVHHLHGEEEK